MFQLTRSDFLCLELPPEDSYISLELVHAQKHLTSNIQHACQSHQHLPLNAKGCLRKERKEREGGELVFYDGNYPIVH